jgi:hypothetical protein
VHEVMLDDFAAPPRDRYQVLTEHRSGQLICEDTGLAPSDLIVSVIGNSREDWSFGMGRAQFLEGDL